MNNEPTRFKININRGTAILLGIVVLAVSVTWTILVYRGIKYLITYIGA